MSPNDSVFTTIAAPLHTKHGASFIKIRDVSHDDIFAPIFICADQEYFFFRDDNGKVAEEMFISLFARGRETESNAPKIQRLLTCKVFF